MKISPFAGKLPEVADLIDLDKLNDAYYSKQPDPKVEAQRVSFGTSGHRGCSFDSSFNLNHILAITQSICLYRKTKHVTGPLFLGFDTHALSQPAFKTALQVLAANGVSVLIAKNQEYTPTPVISHAILSHNKKRLENLADGIIITPSHNPPEDGGFKYNPVHGGPAEKEITNWIQSRANEFLEKDMNEVKQLTFPQALAAKTTEEFDFLNPYVRDLENIIDMEIIRKSKIRIGVDPMGGAGVHYWQAIADYYEIDLTVLNTQVDPQFAFMTCDWDGRIRMDPSSTYAMKSLIEKSAPYAISFACDTDHDRHGIVVRGLDGQAELMPPNHFLCASIQYLFHHRENWPIGLKVGKTLVSSQLIDRICKDLKKSLYEVPVGFKWFVQGLLRGELGFAGEESAGATFLRKNGEVWTTDKDGIVPALLAAEMTASLGRDPARQYESLTQKLGKPYYLRVEFEATAREREKIAAITPEQVKNEKLAEENITQAINRAPGNGALIGGIKIETNTGWLALRPSGTESIYKIYAESFENADVLDQLIKAGQKLANKLIKS